MGAGPFLLAVLAVMSNKGWANPGMIEKISISSTASISLTTHSVYAVTTVYETTCNQTFTGTGVYASSKKPTSTSGSSSFRSSSTGNSVAPSPSYAQSASSHQYEGQSASSPTTLTEQSSSHASTAQGALSSTLILEQHPPQTIPTSSGDAQRSTRQSTSSSPSSGTQTSSSRFSRSQTPTPKLSTSSRSTLISSHERSSSRSSSSESSSNRGSSSYGSSSTTSSFSFNVPSGYTLVKLSTSSSTQSVPSGYSLEPLENSISYPSTTSTLQRSSTSRSSSQSSSSSSHFSVPTYNISTSTKVTTRRSSSYNVPKASITATITASINLTTLSISSFPPNASLATTASSSAIDSLNASTVSIAPWASASSSRSAVLAASSASKAAARETATVPNCNDGTWDLTVANYQKYSTDANLKIWWHGGTDNETGVTWPAKTAPGTYFTEALAGSFEPVGEQFVCNLEQHSCQPADGCQNYQVHIPQGTPQTGVAKYFDQVGPSSHYGWFAVHSIANLFSFSESFVSGLQTAGTQIAAENLQLTQTFTKPTSQDIFTRSILLGFAMLVAILFAFVPVIGEIIGPTIMGASTAIIASGAAGAAAIVSTGLSSTGGFIGLSLANGASLDTKAATFGSYMAMVFNNTAGAIDQYVNQLMNGVAVNAAPGATDPSLLGLLEGGGWVNTSVITNPNLSITAMTQIMRDDLVQRGINYIWLQSKIYVTFADLNDDVNGTKCMADKNGWQASKTCADGGVYYLYRFNEDGNLIGHLDYPWGADKMTDEPFDLQPSWVTASSAKSYRSQNGGVGGFNYDPTTPPANLSDALSIVAQTGKLDSLRVLPGVWNISVCDMGTHNDWNGDFTQKPMVTENKDGLSFFFPCCCGPQCTQTHDFIMSAQMENFKTIYDTCQTQLTLCKAWPPGVESIDFGDAGTITNGSCLPGDTMPDTNDYSSTIFK